MMNQIIKTVAPLFITIGLAQISFAQSTGPIDRGAVDSGGVPPVAMAIALQPSADADGKFDEIGREIFLTIAARHVAQDRVAALSQRTSDQSVDRKYFCIQYFDYDNIAKATKEFEKALKGSPSVEIVFASNCK